MRRLLVLALLCACGRAAPAPVPAAQPPWIAANFVGEPPAALLRSREGMLRWTGLWGTRRLQHASLVSRVAVSPDGTWIASACWDGTVKLWESKSGREIRTLDMGQEVFGLAISPDGRRIYTGDERGEIRLSDAASGIALKSWQLHWELWRLALSPDGSLLAFCGKDGFKLCEAFTLDFANHDWAQAVQWKEPVRSVAFSPDGTKVVTCGNDNLVRVWQYPSGAMTTFTGPDESEPWFDCVAVDPHGTEIAASWKSGEILRWRLKNGEALPTFKGEDEGQAEEIRYSPDGKQLAATYGDDVRLWDRATGRMLRQWRAHDDCVSSIAFAPDGSWLVTGGEDGAVRVWDVATGEERLGGERLPELTGLDVSGDGTWVAAAHFTEARVWDTATGMTRRRVTRGDEAISSVMITADGKVESVWTRHFEGEHGGIMTERQTVLWDPATGETLHVSASQERGTDLPAAIQSDKMIGEVAIAPDGSKIAGAGKDGTVRLWAKDGGELGVLHGHSNEVKCVAWSDDGRWIFSGGEDSFVRVWDAAKGEEKDLLPVDGGPEVLVFRKGRLYVGCANRTVCVYEFKG